MSLDYQEAPLGGSTGRGFLFDEGALIVVYKSDGSVVGFWKSFEPEG